MLSFKPPEFAKTGCKQCDDLTKISNGRVRYCLSHDPSLTPEERKRYAIEFEKLKEYRKKEAPC